VTAAVARLADQAVLRHAISSGRSAAIAFRYRCSGAGRIENMSQAGIQVASVVVPAPPCAPHTTSTPRRRGPAVRIHAGRPRSGSPVGGLVEAHPGSFLTSKFVVAGVVFASQSGVPDGSRIDGVLRSDS